MFKCLHEGCINNKHAALGYCLKHYRQFKNHGKTLKSSLKDFNEIIDKGTYYELILTNVKCEEIGRAKIDKEDLNLVRSIGRWSLSNEGYVYNSSSKKCFLMHRLLLNVIDNPAIEVDHRKTGLGYRSDNRRKNLRICNKSQNMSNVGLTKSNKSGHKGVSWHKKAGKWVVNINIDNKSVYLGLFENKSDAIRAYKNKATEVRGKFLHKSLRK